MALITNFIQASKITELATALISRKTVFSSIADVKMGFKGSSAQIPVLSSGTVGDYTPGIDMTVNNTSSSNITIALDQNKYINDYLDDVDEASAAQSALPQLLNTLTTNMATTVDQYALQTLWNKAGTTDATALGVTLTPITVTEDNIDDYLTSIDRLLTEADAPEDGRYAVITPKMAQSLTLNNVYVAASTDEMARKRGYRGMYANLEIYVSNNLPAGVLDLDHDLAAGEKGVLAGVKGAGNVLFNYDKFRVVEAEDRFGQKYQAVSNYGAGANTPAWLVWGVIAEA